MQTAPRKTAENRGKNFQPAQPRLRPDISIVVRQVFKPVLRNRNTQGQHTRSTDPVDQHYHNLCQEMRRLFKTLKIAV
jgi:hypothetical protein